MAARGDAALIEATRKFDRLELDAGGLRVTAGRDRRRASKACDAATLDALKFARDRIEAFHRRQLPKDERFTDALGVELGWRWTRDRRGRALCARRHRGLSVLGADERRAGQGRRRARAS